MKSRKIKVQSPKYSQHKQAAHAAVTILDSTDNKVVFLCPHTQVVSVIPYHRKFKEN